MVGAKVDGHVRCVVGIVVWGRMCGNRELGGGPGSLLLYIILGVCNQSVLCPGHWDFGRASETSLDSPLKNLDAQAACFALLLVFCVFSRRVEAWTEVQQNVRHELLCANGSAPLRNQ